MPDPSSATKHFSRRWFPIGSRVVRWGVRHPWQMILIWALLFIGALPLTFTLSSHFKTDGLGVPHSESAQVDTILRHSFRYLSNPTATVVFFSPHKLWTSEAKQLVSKDLTRLKRVSHVVQVPHLTSLQISPDRHVAWGPVVFQQARPGSLVDIAQVPKLRQALHSSKAVQAGITGLLPLERAFTVRINQDLKVAELWTLPMTLIALIFIFRSLVAPIGPLAIGFGGITVGLGLVNILARWMALAPEVQDAAAMIGLGVGIDYALLIVHRYRVARYAGEPPRNAAYTAARTAGRAVLFSGAIVASAFLVVLLINQPLLRSMALGSLTAVVSTVVAAVTLLPALLVLLDPWLDWPFPPRPYQISQTWMRLAHTVTGRPWVFLITGSAVMLLLAYPVTHIRFWNPGVDTLPKTSQTRVTYDRLLKHTFPGVLGPFSVVVQSQKSLWTAASWKELRSVANSLSRTPDVHTVVPSIPHLPATAFKVGPPSGLKSFLSKNHRVFAFTVLPRSRPESQQTLNLVRHIRTTIHAPSGLSLMVGGSVAYTVDVIHLIVHSLPKVAILIALSTMILLFFLFRSVALPIKAVILNGLSVLAGSGLLVWTFQDGATFPLTGIAATHAIDWTTPVILFSVLFGLSTDYEVFLLSRVMDHHLAGLSDRDAIQTGMAETGRIITGAALIMVTVFLAFGLIGLEFMQELGFGLGLAILLDATIVRVLLVPSIMRLLGKWNWWPRGSQETKNHRIR